MIRGLRPHRQGARAGSSSGYTIIETMVVLAVTAVMFSMAVVLVQGQQAKTEFSQAIRDFDSQLRAAIADTATGFFPGNANFSCDINAGAPLDSAVQISNTPRPQGTNGDCIFLGKVVQFGVNKADCTGPADFHGCNDFNVYTLAGRARVDKAVSTNLQQADPTVVEAVTATNHTRYALHVSRVYSEVPGTSITDYGSVAFLSTLGKYSVASDLLSGAQTVNAMVVPNTSLGQTASGGSSAPERINAMDGLDDVAAAQLTNPDKGILICLQGANGQRGAVAIGANQRKLTTEIYLGGEEDTKWYPGVCPA